MSDTSTALADAVTAVTGFLVSDVPLAETLQRVATLAVSAIEPAIAVGLTLVQDGPRLATYVSTATLASALDQAQYDGEQGPCLTALSERRLVRVGDIRQEGDRWPHFSRVAVAAGVLSSLSVPLTVGEGTYGAFNLYAGSPAAFGPAHEADAQLFATQAAVVLGNARAYWGAYELAEGLKTAMESRAAIEQAKGILMATHHCTPEEA